MSRSPALVDVLSPELPIEALGDRVFTWLGSVLDATVLQAMRLVVDAALMPEPEDLPTLRASIAGFTDGALWKEPRRYFSFVDEPITPRQVAGKHRRTIRGGTIVSREMVTDYQPHLRDAPASASDRILIEHWMHGPGRPSATVVALHGFSMGYPRIDAFALFAAPLFQRGYDVALVTLPFHGARTPADARFSGERFAIPHVGRLNEAMRQAVYEIALVVHWMRECVDAPVGLLGLSLGGYLSALMAGLTADLAFVIPIVPPVCIGDLAWRFFSTSRRYRGDAVPAFTREELRAAYRVHSPLTYPRRVHKNRIMILAGRGDQIVPPDHPHTLWRHWGEPRISWYSGSHLAPFRRGQLFELVASHIQRCVVPA
jgi:pimeloyl-ACP methyl ester carboxylesterase